jgi:hypothetical protein
MVTDNYEPAGPVIRHLIWIAVADNAMLIEIASKFYEPWQRK